jgi:hypothetical protein
MSVSSHDIDILKVRLASSLAFPAGDLGRESLEAMHPEVSKSLQPGIDIAQRSGVQGVDAARAFGANRREPALAQHFEVL